jgi:hypothetical protein
MHFVASEVLSVSLGFTAVAVEPELPSLGEGTVHRVLITQPGGATLEALAVLEYTKGLPSRPVLLRFDKLAKADIPLGSKIEILSNGPKGNG